MTETLTGERVSLRPPVPADKADRLAMGRHAEIVRMFGGSAHDLTPLTEAEADEWFAAIERDPHGWVIEHDGRCIGSARLHSIDAETGTARYAVGILDPALLGRGLGREVTGLVLTYAFDALGLRRVDLRVLALNTRAIRSYEAGGFQKIRVEKDAVTIDGESHDDVIMAIERAQWRANMPS